MDISQILWGINTCLVGVILYLIKDMKGDIEKRTLIVTCDKIHEALKDTQHLHATTGTAGEVVKTP